METARTTFSTKKTEITAKYNKILDDEYGAILKANPKVKKSSSKKKGESSSSNNGIKSTKSAAERKAYRETAYKKSQSKSK